MKRLPLTRRQMLSGLSASLLLPVGLRVPSVSGSPGNPFQHGVASGDPEQSSTVLWTRLTTTAKSVECGWEVAQTPQFDNILQRGSLATGPQRDHTIKVVVAGLTPGATYYYRFRAGQHTSPTGRTRTLADGTLESLGLAVASCSNFPFGYFNAYEAIARDESVEFVLHLGDYLYEYGPDGYGGGIGAQLGRQHNPPREMVSLADYRQRHAQYKADPQSRAMHAAHPLIPLWDDHESTNNPWLGGAENHQPAAEGSWQTRRSVSLQAWYEWMPVREPASDEDPRGLLASLPLRRPGLAGDPRNTAHWTGTTDRIRHINTAGNDASERRKLPPGRGGRTGPGNAFGRHAGIRRRSLGRVGISETTVAFDWQSNPHRENGRTTARCSRHRLP